MRFAIDVAHLDADGVVVRTTTMRRHRVGLPVWRARTVIEASAGAFERWGLCVGDVVEVRHIGDEPASGNGRRSADDAARARRPATLRSSPSWWPPVDGGRRRYAPVGGGGSCSSARRSATSATCRRGRSRRCRSAALICCEDTRRTGRLLQHAGITGARLAVANEHTEAARVAEVLDVLAAGGDVAVVTDAGTPGISDPG